MYVYDPYGRLLLFQSNQVSKFKEPILFDQDLAASSDLGFIGIQLKVCVAHYFTAFGQLALPIVQELTTEKNSSPIMWSSTSP